MLTASFRASGLTVTQSVDGVVHALTPAADLTAYRVIQESLTNVRKHSRCPTARLHLRYGPDTLRITIEDEGGPAGAPDEAVPPAHSGGHGLIGMHERVTAVGGELRAGPRPEGGYRVCSTLPYTSPYMPPYAPRTLTAPVPAQPPGAVEEALS